MNTNRHIAVVSCCTDDWGGSEDLWSATMYLLKNKGFKISVYKDHFNPDHPEVKKLRQHGFHLVDLDRKTSLVKKGFKKLRQAMSGKADPQLFLNGQHSITLKKRLARDKPALVIINQGINFDGLSYAYQCMLQHIPYCIITHKAVDFYWPPPAERAQMIETLKNARHCYFVSVHNKTLTEEQFGFRFTNASVIWNPVKFRKQPIPFPAAGNIIKLACIGRLFIIDKGQDILLRIISKEPWKSRNIEISFAGSGADEQSLRDLVKLLDIKNVNFLGQVSDVSEIWKTHHALLLPSRSEGMALSVLEAMAVGRPVIVTNAGGHHEIIKHGINGFISDASEAAFHANMEFAWQQRAYWSMIGQAAAASINEKLPASPENDFSLYILNLLNVS